ncbi:Na+/H+ antiporter subunit E [Neorhizobium sp. SOG26]|uniref:Na+/H+ antiporter subunit E n=1 Tax=Neorhizobium turbinariae TaxID=2937795 RepID=A0ABT0IRF5_9HYPH|nr:MULTISPECIES: Na+/H+ antiporter subunit E [Neorhizobium]AXV14744.1 Na+/H+ antiporter subunit E [Neorhizobium sp. SOG26]MCK8780462.1 Na+/H+ antiporter subunit E [Neorhizobium turbinariae]
MITFILTLVFGLIWVVVTGSATGHNLLFGLALATLALWVVRREMNAHGYWPRVGKFISLVVLFFRELAMSAWKVAVLVTRRRMDLKPGIFAFPLTVDRDFEITLLANLITLTPGTLSVDVSEDRKTLFVHAIDCSDIEGAKRDIAEGFERKIMEAFR